MSPVQICRGFVAAGLVAFAFGAPARAEDGNAAAADIMACGAVRGDKARLKCFEKALPALREAFPAARSLAAARTEEARLAAAEEAKEEFGLPAKVAAANDPFEEEAFGAETLPPAARADAEDNDDQVDAIEAAIVEIGRTARGKLLIILDNGQIWRQLDSDSSTPYFPKSAEGLTATVQKAALGSYRVRISGTRDAFKARRIK